MNVYRAFVSIVDRIGEGDLVDVLVGEHRGLQGLVHGVQGERLLVVLYGNGKVSNDIVKVICL